VAEERSLPVPEGLDGERIDVALSRLLGLSRSKSAELVVAGHVDLSGRPASKGDRVEAGQWLAIRLPDPPAPPQIIAEPVPGLRVVYDDADLVVVDKPAGVAAHPSPGWEGPTVIGGLAAAGYRIATSGAAERQGVVHRLDVGTTGLMAVAKTEAAYADLKRQFKDRSVDKVYRSIVQGHLDPLSGTIDAPIGRHPGADWRMAVVAGGRPSITHYDTLEAFAHASLVRIELETGRKKLELDVETRKQQIERYSLQQYQTKRNEEYRALAHEIELAKQAIRGIEDQELEIMERIEGARKVAAAAAQDALQIQAEAEQALADLDARQINLTRELGKLEQERNELAAQIDEASLTRYERLRRNKGTKVLVGIEHGVCGGCHMRLPAQILVTCQAQKEVTQCINCGRLLYYTRDMNLVIAE